ncbi:MAG: pyridoxal-phosphate dependent enzyme [Bacteroidetes bacterium]|nr:pyridoxal-phosphate dependent enzyme [Bacteroidota bacterium]
MMQTPLFQKIENNTTKEQRIHLYILRLDVMDLYSGGNKFFKLKYNLEEAQAQGHLKIVTFGGAWSNHLAACAAIHPGLMQKGMRITAIVRGEEPKKYASTLLLCKEKGMDVQFISREAYRNKNEAFFLEELKNKLGAFYLLPEGGSNHLAVKGCMEITSFIPIAFDTICCPVGSGGTLAGITASLHQKQQALGFLALKGASKSLEQKIQHFLSLAEQKERSFSLMEDYAFGGFAKVIPQLRNFKKEFEQNFGFELDYIYTAKMMFGIFDQIKKKHFKPNSTIVAVHTGGLQGNKGFEE